MAAAPVPRNTGPKWGKRGRMQNRLRLVEGGRVLIGRKGAMAWRMALLGSNMTSLGFLLQRRNTQGRVEGAFSYLNWRRCTGSCSAGSTRPDADLRPPSIAAFGRSRSSAAVDRGSRPRPPPQIAGSRIGAMPIHVE